MIIDKIENAYRYYALSEDIEVGLRYLAEKKYPSVPTPRFQINERTSINVTEYTPQPLAEREWEAHNHCVDIQFVISGCEGVGYAHRDDLTYVGSHESKDKLTYHGEGDLLLLSAGHFCIFFPEDVHKPKLFMKNESNVTKAVVKVSI